MTSTKIKYLSPCCIAAGRLFTQVHKCTDRGQRSRHEKEHKDELVFPETRYKQSEAIADTLYHIITQMCWGSLSAQNSETLRTCYDRGYLKAHAELSQAATRQPHEGLSLVLWLYRLRSISGSETFELHSTAPHPLPNGDVTSITNHATSTGHLDSVKAEYPPELREQANMFLAFMARLASRPEP